MCEKRVVAWVAGSDGLRGGGGFRRVVDDECLQMTSRDTVSDMRGRAGDREGLRDGTDLRRAPMTAYQSTQPTVMSSSEDREGLVAPHAFLGSRVRDPDGCDEAFNRGLGRPTARS